MDFELASEAAARLGCTARAVQKWAKEGKIPYAYKDGRDWKIPTTAVKPHSMAEKTDQYFNEPYPIIHNYSVGKAKEYIDSIKNEDDRTMALCEYYYLIGDMKRCTILAEPYLDSKNPILCSTAALFCIFSNLCRGHIVKTQYAAEILNEQLNKSVSSTDMGVKAVNVFNSIIAVTQLHLPVETVPLMKDYMKYLDEGLKMFSCYLTAYKAYLERDYSKALGIIETALSFSEKVYPVTMIYLYIIKSMAHVNLMQIDEALESIDVAWSFAEPDGMFIPFVEHYSLLQGVVEKHFKKSYPVEYSKIIQAAKHYNHTWYEVYNQKNNAQVAQNLTHTEFTIAMLYSRNWRAKEIAAHIELSERTIMNYIAVIYDKLGINSRKQLEKFMLR